MKPSSLGARPRLFLADAGMSAPAGLRSERSASIIRMDERAFLTQTSAVASFISIAPPVAAELAPSARVASARSMTLDE